jgi:hypothetical protein
MEPQLHECYLFSDLSPSMMPISVRCFFDLAISTSLTHSIQGLVRLDAGFDFVGYVSIGEQRAILFPLYVGCLFLENCKCLITHQCLSTSLEAVGGSFIGCHTLTISVAQATDLPGRLYSDTDYAQRNGNCAPFRVRTWVRAHIHSGIQCCIETVPCLPTD